MELFDRTILKIPLQIQLYITYECNRSCPWCIEKENMEQGGKENPEIFLCSLKKVLQECNRENIPYNVVITGGEPFLKRDFINEILNYCSELSPQEMYIKSLLRQAFKVGINTNGDFGLIQHKRLSYINVTYIDELIKFNSNCPIRLQTIYSKDKFPKGLEDICKLATNAFQYGYKDFLIREIVGIYKKKDNIIPIENQAYQKMVLTDFQFNVYDMWHKYLFLGKDFYIKKQLYDLQLLWERNNEQKNICSLVIWPEGFITPSWTKNYII